VTAPSSSDLLYDYYFLSLFGSRRYSLNKHRGDNNDEEDEEEQSEPGGVLQLNFMNSPINAI
jgi:hypothetical protein